MKSSIALCGVALNLLCLASPSQGEMPRVLDERLELSLVAREPEIVTPIGLAFDARGRLLVIESHTHFPPDDYAGPSVDRIRLLEDTTGDGLADRFGNFYEGGRATMSIARGPDGWIYVATRMEVYRLRDTEGDGRADEREGIARLDTAGDYPHNGLCGLWFDGDATLYFGLGENLGVDYRLIGSDGSEQRGGGEGGSIYRCRADGSGLTRVATGFWNPFGICLDEHGRLFAVDNDPDASPPCRLLHVVEGGDYGYQFRYGRSGKHPLQAWDGEFPGTLPMAAGTSEAPSAVLPYQGQLWVTSWGENRIERFTLAPRGASFRAAIDVVVQGDNDFRPVDFAVAPDGSLYFTDWVDRSYNVHRRGRVWRLRWKELPADEVAFPAITEAERRAAALASAPHAAALDDEDPFLRHAAVMGLVDSSQVRGQKLGTLNEARLALGLLEAARRSSISTARRDELLRDALQSPFAEVQQYAARWIADERLSEFRDAMEGLLASDAVTVPTFRAVVAAVDWLDRGTVSRSGAAGGEALLLAVLDDATRPDHLRMLALRLLDPTHPTLTTERLRELITTSNGPLRREAVRSLVLSAAEDRIALLEEVALDESLDVALRADAASGLPPGANALERLSKSSSAELRETARRQLRRGAEARDDATDSLPDVGDTDAWLALLGTGGDGGAGWRVFFGAGGVRCAACHTLQGQGTDLGPDLSGIVQRMGRRRVLQSLLEPSREIAPRYVPWTIETTDGRVFTALSLGVPSSGPIEEFLAADGTRFEIARDEIAARHPSDQSIMPSGLHTQLSLAELRDLLALLATP